jgi:hypothetical protein
MDICVTVGMIMVNTEKWGNTSVIVLVLGMMGRSVVDFGETLYIHQVWFLVLSMHVTLVFYDYCGVLIYSFSVICKC